VPELNTSEIAIGKLTWCESPGVDWIPAEGETLHSKIHNL
jgi:hypothetical protein